MTNDACEQLPCVLDRRRRPSTSEETVSLWQVLCICKTKSDKELCKWQRHPKSPSYTLEQDAEGFLGDGRTLFCHFGMRNRRTAYFTRTFSLPSLWESKT